MKTPTPKQIKDEIKRLKKLKPRVPQHTFFGDDNHKAIEIEIEVLEKNLSEDDLSDWEDNEYLFSHARDAANWLSGDWEEKESISEQWLSLVR